MRPNQALSPTKMKLHLDKIGVARRQLRQCIHMLFAKADPVAVHTLAAAAHQILYDLAKAKGHHGNLRRPRVVRPERHREWNRYLNAPQNFFKHADKDPDKTIDFEPDVTHFFILDALTLLQGLGLKLAPAEHLFSVWFALKRPEFLIIGAFRDQITATAKTINVDDFEAIRTVLGIMEGRGPTSGSSGRPSLRSVRR